MLTPVYTNSFAKDIKRVSKRGKNMKKLKDVIEMLLQELPLSVKYRDHQLLGNYQNRRECHIEPDWLLIYKLDNSSTVIFERTGSHSDLF